MLARKRQKAWNPEQHDTRVQCFIATEGISGFYWSCYIILTRSQRQFTISMSYWISNFTLCQQVKFFL